MRGARCAQVPLACASGALVGAAALQVLASALAAAYCGFLYGAVLGGTQALAWVALSGLRCVRLALAAPVLGLRAAGIGLRAAPRVPGAVLRALLSGAWACVVA